MAILGKEIRGLGLIRKLVGDVWPMADQRLESYKSLLERAEDGQLIRQALDGIKYKRFHALGGCVYALYPGVEPAGAVSFITALQTISDYLDNLCDRSGVRDEAAFRQLHLSMLHAVDPSLALSDYYISYPYKYDNGYLQALVEECRSALAGLPSYGLVRERIKRLVGLYSTIQSLKHLDKPVGEEKLAAWADGLLKDYPGVSCWEFSAAAGSTLGIFVLFAAAHDPELDADGVERICSAYFPWISGLHILLDYYIDSEEDRESGDLNFTHYYDDRERCRQRLSFFIRQSAERCRELKHPGFHLTVVRGLLAMYLSDPKADPGACGEKSRSPVRAGGLKAYLYLSLCGLLRRRGRL